MYESQRIFDPLYSAAKLQVKKLRQRFDQQRLGQARRTGNQTVPAGKRCDQKMLDNIFLADDNL